MTRFVPFMRQFEQGGRVDLAIGGQVGGEAPRTQENEVVAQQARNGDGVLSLQARTKPPASGAQLRPQGGLVLHENEKEGTSPTCAVKTFVLEPEGSSGDSWFCFRLPARWRTCATAQRLCPQGID